MTEQLKFEVGKSYMTRDKRKATIDLIKPRYMVGEIEIAVQNPTVWNSSGGFYSEPIPCDLDLVAEWREPARVTVKLYRSSRDGSIASFTKSYPTSETYWQLIAQREIVEGEGLE